MESFLGDNLGTQFRGTWCYGGWWEQGDLLEVDTNTPDKSLGELSGVVRTEMESKGSNYREAMYERDAEFEVLVTACLQGLTFGMWN